MSGGLEFSARRLRRRLNELSFDCDNPQYPPIVVGPDDDFEIIGVLLCILHPDLTTQRLG